MAVRTDEGLVSTTSVDRTALGAWAGSRLAVLLLSVGVALFSSYGDLKDSFLDRWTQWDVDLFIEIAKYGYRGDPSQPPDAGLPAQHTTLGQFAHDFLGEKRVPGGPFDDRLAESVYRGVRPEKAGEQCGSV